MLAEPLRDEERSVRRQASGDRHRRRRHDQFLKQPEKNAKNFTNWKNHFPRNFLSFRGSLYINDRQLIITKT